MALFWRFLRLEEEEKMMPSNISQDSVSQIAQDWRLTMIGSNIFVYFRCILGKKAARQPQHRRGNFVPFEEQDYQYVFKLRDRRWGRTYSDILQK